MKFGDPEKISNSRILLGYILGTLSILLLLYLCYGLYLSSEGAPYTAFLPLLILAGCGYIWNRYHDNPLVRIAFYVICALAIGAMVYQDPQEDYRVLLIGSGLILFLEVTINRHEDKPLFEIKDGSLYFKTNLGGWQACPLERFEGKVVTEKELFMELLIVPVSSKYGDLRIWLGSLRKKERREFLERLREAVAKANHSSDQIGRER